MDSWPDFLIIGTPKSGTTSFYDNISKHSKIQENRKEIEFFNTPDYFNKACHKAYHRNFDSPLIQGEATPNYLYNPHVPGRIKQYIPNVKLIVILREPVGRMFSDWRHQYLRYEKLGFDIALKEEATRTAKEYEKQLDDPTYYSYNIWHFSYQAKSMYLKYIQDWFRYFPKEQFHFIIFEELIKNPTKVYYDFFEFIGLDNERIPNELSNVNLRVNIKMKDDYRLSLMKKFEPMIKDLEKLIDKDLSIWLKKK